MLHISSSLFCCRIIETTKPDYWMLLYLSLIYMKATNSYSFKTSWQTWSAYQCEIYFCSIEAYTQDTFKSLLVLIIYNTKKTEKEVTDGRVINTENSISGIWNVQFIIFSKVMGVSPRWVELGLHLILLSKSYLIKGNVWVTISSHSKAYLILTS